METTFHEKGVVKFITHQYSCFQSLVKKYFFLRNQIPTSGFRVATQVE